MKVEVAIFMVTHNHERFISRAIESALSHFDKCTIRIRDYSTYVEVFPDYKKAFKRLILSAYCEAFLSAFKKLNIKGLFHLLRLVFKS